MSIPIHESGRTEPRLDDGAPLEGISFLERDKPIIASSPVRAWTYLSVGLYLAWSMYRALQNGAGAPALLGVLLACGLQVMLPVWISMWWEQRKNKARRHIIAAIAATVLLGIQILGFLNIRGTFENPGSTGAPDARKLSERAMRCQSNGDLACAESNWKAYLSLRPADVRARVTLGVVRSRRDDHPGAISEFEHAIGEGAGAYDLFAHYAHSLSQVGRSRDAIDWYYSALAAAPQLVDVRSALSRLLVAESRHYEALALLQEFDARLEAAGRPAQFAAQRISIEDGIRKAHSVPASAAPASVLRLSGLDGHFYAPVTVGWSRPSAFMVDTGATLTSLSTRLLSETGAAYQTLDPAATMVTADNRKVRAKVILLDRLQVGGHVLRNIRAVVCDDCVSLLGNSALSWFDMHSSKVRGVEFLALSPRGPVADR